MQSPERWRARELGRLRARLLRGGFPRLEMALLVGATGLVGLVASWALHGLGLVAMGWRYLFAVTIAYGVFLLLLRAWLHVRRDDWAPDVSLPDASSTGPGGEWTGGGGDFGGAGASASFDAPGEVLGESVGNAALEAAGADEAGCLLVPVLLLAALALSALVVVWSAPTLFAEVLLDVLLAAGLYRRLRRMPDRHWLGTAVRHTIWPFALTALFVAGAGFALQHLAPTATTLGEAMKLL